MYVYTYFFICIKTFYEVENTTQNVRNDIVNWSVNANLLLVEKENDHKNEEENFYDEVEESDHHVYEELEENNDDNRKVSNVLSDAKVQENQNDLYIEPNCANVHENQNDLYIEPNSVEQNQKSNSNYIVL